MKWLCRRGWHWKKRIKDDFHRQYINCAYCRFCRMIMKWNDLLPMSYTYVPSGWDWEGPLRTEED